MRPTWHYDYMVACVCDICLCVWCVFASVHERWARWMKQKRRATADTVSQSHHKIERQINNKINIYIDVWCATVFMNAVYRYIQIMYNIYIGECVQLACKYMYIYCASIDEMAFCVGTFGWCVRPEMSVECNFQTDANSAKPLVGSSDCLTY